MKGSDNNAYGGSQNQRDKTKLERVFARLTEAHERRLMAAVTRLPEIIELAAATR